MDNGKQKPDEELLKKVDAVINEPNAKQNLKLSNVVFALVYSIGIILLILIDVINGKSSNISGYVLTAYVALGLCLLICLLYMIFVRKELPVAWGWLGGSVGKGIGALTLGAFYMIILVFIFIFFWPR